MKGRGATLPGLLVVAVLLAGVLVLHPGAEFADLRRLFGFGPDRLNAALPVHAGGGTYKFLHTQPGSDDPVSYSPCRPIRYEINPQGAPEDHVALVKGSVARVAVATGFRFEYVGTTTSRNFLARPPDPDEPVLIGWADEEEVPDLAGDIAGLGGSTMVSRGPARREYVTGMVVLDRDTFDALMRTDLGRASAAAIMDHELAHLVGLDHVEDRGELMHAAGAEGGSFGPGDLEGLARLGRAPC